MRDINDYHFIYEDSMGHLHHTTNPLFIAQYPCIAIEKARVPDIEAYLEKRNKGEFV